MPFYDAATMAADPKQRPPGFPSQPSVKLQQNRSRLHRRAQGVYGLEGYAGGAGVAGKRSNDVNPVFTCFLNEDIALLAGYGWIGFYQIGEV